jgi:lactate dehydrogenase-like 2-hydroxyacid dehydrogenase
MGKPRVFVSRAIFPEAYEMIEAEADAELWPDELPPPRDVLLAKVKGVDGLLCLLTDKVDAELMEAAGPQLKVVSQIAVGFDNIDIPEATRRNIPVGNTPEVLTQTTADATWALLMAAARRIVEGSRAVREGKWRTWHPLHYLGQDVYGSTLGIFGMGRIGLEVARRARGFDMEVLYTDVVRREDIEAEHSLRFVDQDTLLRESDFVSLHCVLNEDTHHLISEDALLKMKPTAVLVNASRGPVVDSGALYRALRDGVIGAAGLDVTDPEPIPMDDPLLTLDNCIIVPHIASASVKTRGEMSRIAAQNLINGIKGERLITCVNPEVYGR